MFEILGQGTIEVWKNEYRNYISLFYVLFHFFLTHTVNVTVFFEISDIFQFICNQNMLTFLLKVLKTCIYVYTRQDCIIIVLQFYFYFYDLNFISVNRWLSQTREVSGIPHHKFEVAHPTSSHAL